MSGKVDHSELLQFLTQNLGATRVEVKPRHRRVWTRCGNNAVGFFSGVEQALEPQNATNITGEIESFFPRVES
jgi:hypothetical protein